MVFSILIFFILCGIIRVFLNNLIGKKMLISNTKIALITLVGVFILLASGLYLNSKVMEDKEIESKLPKDEFYGAWVKQDTMNYINRKFEPFIVRKVGKTRSLYLIERPSDHKTFSVPSMHKFAVGDLVILLHSNYQMNSVGARADLFEAIPITK